MHQHPDYSNLYVSRHPLICDKLTRMRDTQCHKTNFKRFLSEIALLMAYEVTYDLPLISKSVTTPVSTADLPVLKDEYPVIIPILRAGLGMSNPLEAVIPEATVGHIGLYRDEETKKPVEYLVRLPELGNRDVLLVDPMLATGHSAAYAVKLLRDAGVSEARIKIMALVAAPEGIECLHDQCPDVRVYVAALDEKLNKKAYIVPGLGDAGDRLFGTM